MPPMQVRVPFLKRHLPELEALSERQQLKILSHPSIAKLAKRHMTLMRIGWAFLPAGLFAYLVLSHTRVDPRIIGVVLFGCMIIAIVCMVGSVFLFHRRSTRLLKLLAHSVTLPEG